MNRSLAAALAVSALAAGCAHRAAQSTPAAAGSAVQAAPASASDGGRVYAMNCSSCHQTDGTGVPGAFPPLDANPDVTGDPRVVIARVKLGTSGTLLVAGERYHGTMPSWNGVISDDDIAAVVTFVRSAWHNHSGPVSVADVRAVTREAP